MIVRASRGRLGDASIRLIMLADGLIVCDRPGGPPCATSAQAESARLFGCSIEALSNQSRSEFCQLSALPRFHPRTRLLQQRRS